MNTQKEWLVAEPTLGNYFSGLHCILNICILHFLDKSFLKNFYWEWIFKAMVEISCDI